MAGFREKWPIVSGGYSENSRFWEIPAGDRVRPALRDESPVQSLNISPLLSTHAASVLAVADALVERWTLSRTEIDSIIGRRDRHP
jgi:hypothetical protein